MTTEAYRAALDAAIREYERAAADRAVLDARIAQLQQTIGTLTRLCGLTPTVPLGLADACRMVLRGAGAPMTAVQMRERLDAVGLVDLSKYANALSAIHTTLKRLSEAGEAASVDFGDTSRTGYQIVTRTATAPRTVVIDGGQPRSAHRPRAPKGVRR
jgi:hypothetical protein